MSTVIDAVLRLRDSFTPVMQNVTKNISEHQKQQERVSKSIVKTGNNIASLGAKMSMLSAPILGAAVAGAKLNSEFTTGLAKVSTLVDTTVVDMQKMRSEMIQLSNETGKSVTELAEGTYQAISAGVDANKVMDFMKVSALGAKAGFTDMTTATDSLTTVLNAYGMQTEQASTIMDKLIVTQNLGKTTVGEMGAAFGKVIPSAAAAGVSIDELLASVSSLTANGIPTAEAMTGMKAALSNIIKPAEQASKAAQQLGIDFSASHLKSVGFAKFLEEIKEKTNGSQEQMAKLFGSTEALNSIVTLTGPGAEKFAQSLDGISKAAGATDEAIAKLDATPAAKLEKAVNSLKNSGMELAQGLTPLISRTALMTKAFANFLNNLTPVQKELLFGFGQFIIVSSFALVTVGKFIAVGGRLYGSFVKITSAVNTAGGVIPALANKFSLVTKAISAIGRAFLALRNPFMLIRALFATNPLGLALLALTLVIPLVIKHFDKFKEVMTTVFNHMKETVNPILNNFKNKFSQTFEKISMIVKKFEPVYNKVMSLFGSETVNAGNIISTVLNTIGALFEAVFDLTAIVVSGFVNIFFSHINMIINVASNLIDFVSNVFTGNWSGAWENVKAIFTSVIDGIKSIFSSMIDTLSSGLDYILGKASNAQNASAQAGAGETEEHWTGSTWFSGGKTWIHEKGAELVNLPTGTQIVPHSESLKQQYQKGLADGTAKQAGSTNISIAKLADSIIVREDADIDKIANAIAFKLKQYSMNNFEGAY